MSFFAAPIKVKKENSTVRVTYQHQYIVFRDKTEVLAKAHIVYGRADKVGPDFKMPHLGKGGQFLHNTELRKHLV